MENERKKKFQDYAPPEQKPSGGYNLNGVYYSRDGQRLDDQPKKSWMISQRRAGASGNTSARSAKKYTAGRNGSREKVRLMRREIRSRTIRESKRPSQLL